MGSPWASKKGQTEKTVQTVKFCDNVQNVNPSYPYLGCPLCTSNVHNWHAERVELMVVGQRVYVTRAAAGHVPQGYPRDGIYPHLSIIHQICTVRHSSSVGHGRTKDMRNKQAFTPKCAKLVRIINNPRQCTGPPRVHARRYTTGACLIGRASAPFYLRTVNNVRKYTKSNGVRQVDSRPG